MMEKESLFVNRELSWMEFNRRVLDEALNDEVPLLERVKFLAIFSSNLDEFFMVRVARLKRRIREGDAQPGPDGLTPSQALHGISEMARRLSTLQHACFLEKLRPRLEDEGVHIVQGEQLAEPQQAFLEDYFNRTVFPVLTPLAIDPGHPFPYLANRGLCLVAALNPTSDSDSVLPDANLSVVHTPAHVIPRFIEIPSDDGAHRFIRLEEVLRMYLPQLYRGYEILSCHTLRVTRDAEYEPTAKIRSDDLLQSIEQGIKERRMGGAVRLQHDEDMPEHILSLFVDELELGQDDLYAGKGFTAFTDLFELYAKLDLPHLKDRPFAPLPVKAFEGGGNIWSTIRHSDVLVQHPYHSFDAVTQFVDEAAEDPNVLAIKMTLYRVSPSSPIVQSLGKAAEAGKEVAVLLELQARFDEEANISWARTLENVGAHVVYGIVGLKTHCKLCLVVRREAGELRRYCHLGTGNYNARTASIYSDFSLFTGRDSFGEDVNEVFNLLTGYTRQRRLNNLVVAPADLRDAFVDRIRREVAHVEAGHPGRIVAKLNSLVDPRLIDELYAASRAGVSIDLIVRGICCLRPGVQGLSENIRVRSIIDRYLEHARVYHFANGGDPDYLLASADWMQRNLDRRVEVAFPVLEPGLQRTIDEVLSLQLRDNTKAWNVLPDGTSERIARNGQAPVRSQEETYSVLGSPLDANRALED